MIKLDFDACPENILNTKTFDELKVKSLKDVDPGNVLLFIRDLLATAGLDLQSNDNVDDVRTGIDCTIAANYVNMALRRVRGL